MPPPSSSGRDYQPDPFDLQIGSMVVFHRAALLHHSQATHDALMQVSADYLWYGQYLQKLSGALPPWDPSARHDVLPPDPLFLETWDPSVRNAVTPPELFLETADWLGHTQSIAKPLFGRVRRHFRLGHRADADRGLFRPTPAVANAVAVVELIQHPDQRWQVLHAEVSQTHRRQGIATLLYDNIETMLGVTLAPSGWLSENAYLFWQTRDAKIVQWHRKHPHLSGLWVSPKTLLDLLMIAQAKLMRDAEGGLPN
jgi:hypothetical protein